MGTTASSAPPRPVGRPFTANYNPAVLRPPPSQAINNVHRSSIPTAPPNQYNQTGDPVRSSWANNSAPTRYRVVPQNQAYMQGQQPVAIGFSAEVLGGGPGGPGRPTQAVQPLPNQQPMPQVHTLQQQAHQLHGNVIEMDTSRDLVLSRVMAADEYLGRMDETDEKIHTLQSLAPGEREAFFDRISQLLGLRGHLQDELLRIEAMLAADDPELKCLREFENFCPRTVEVLRNLHHKQQNIKSVVIGTQVVNVSSGTETGTGTDGPDSVDTGTDPMGIQCVIPVLSETGTQSSGGGIFSVGTGESSTGTDADGEVQEVSEVELKEKHDEEEEHVSKSFAKQIVGTGAVLGKDEMDKLLSEHALSMQALRKKQNMEKEHFRLKAQRLREERMRRRQEDGGSEEEEGEEETLANASKPPADTTFKAGNSAFVTAVAVDSSRQRVQVGPPVSNPSTNTKPGSGSSAGNKYSRQSEADQVSTHSASSRGGDEDGSDLDSESELGSQGYSDDFEDASSDEDSDKEQLRSTLMEETWTKRNKLTSEDFAAMMDAFREQQQGLHKMTDAEREKHAVALAAKLAEKKRKGEMGVGSSEVGDIDTHTNQNHMQDMGTSMEGLTEEEVREIQRRDSNFIQDVLSKRHQMSDEDFQKLLRRHLLDIEDYKKRRRGEKERLDAKLQDKLANRKRGQFGMGGESDSEDDGSDANDEEEIGPEAKAKLQVLDQEFQTKLSRGRHNLTEDELQALLQRYRQDQEAIIRQKKSEKSRMDDKLQQKLAERKKKQPTTNNENVENASELDADFFQKLQEAQDNGEISKAEFTEMLQNYLNKLDSTKKKERKEQRRKKRQEDQAGARQAAIDALQEHQEQKQQITDIRRRERAAIDQRLQEKLRRKKNKPKHKVTEIQGAESDEDF